MKVRMVRDWRSPRWVVDLVLVREKCRFVMFAGGRAEGRRRGQAVRDASRGLRHSVGGDKRLDWRVETTPEWSHRVTGILHHPHCLTG